VKLTFHYLKLQQPSLQSSESEFSQQQNTTARDAENAEGAQRVELTHSLYLPYSLPSSVAAQIAL
jgi:hypothetical protein